MLPNFGRTLSPAVSASRALRYQAALPYRASAQRPLKPALELGSWVAFMRREAGNEVLLMGNLVLTDAEVNPVMERLVVGGTDITALHNHLLSSTPYTMAMHVSGHGDGAKLATTRMECAVIA